MKVAILLKNDRNDSLKKALYFLLITIEKDKIQGISNEYIQEKDLNYISSWFIVHHVVEIYVKETDEETQAYYKRLGITIKTYEDMEQHPIFKSFII